MGAEDVSFAYGDDDGGYRRTIIAISDIHLEDETPQGWRNRLRYGIIPNYLWKYADAFDADELWIGGDIGDEREDVEAIANYGFDRTKIAVGDEDEDWHALLREDAAFQDELDSNDCEYGKKISTVIPGERPFLVQMGHYANQFDIDWDSTADDEGIAGCDTHQLDQPRVVMFGHAHVAREDIIRNSVVLGLGSSFSTYGNGGSNQWNDGPKRNMYVLTFEEEALDTYLIDLDADRPTRYKRFELGEDGFREEVSMMLEEQDLPAQRPVSEAY